MTVILLSCPLSRVSRFRAFVTSAALIVFGCLGATVAYAEDDGWSRALEIRQESSVTRLVELLGDPAEPVRVMAARRLSVVGPDVATAAPELLHALETDPSDEVRQYSALALGRFVHDSTLVVPALERQLRHPSEHVRRAAASGLAFFGNTGFQALARAFVEGQSGVRKTALLTMGFMARDPHLADKLTVDTETQDQVFVLFAAPCESYDIYGGAFLLQAFHPDPERAVPILRDALRDAPQNDRSSIVRTLQSYGIGPDGRRSQDVAPGGTMSGATVDEYLLWVHTAPDDTTGMWKVELDRRQLESIGERLASADKDTLIEALNEVRALGGAARSLVKEVARLIESDRRDHACGVLIGLGEISIPYVIPYLGSEDDAAVRCALEILSQFGTASADGAPAVVASLESPNEWVRHLAVNAISLIDTSRARLLIPDIARNDPSRFVRGGAIRVIPALFPQAKDGLPIVSPYVEEPEATVRRASIVAIGEYGPDAEPTVGILTGGLRDPETGVACAAALERIGRAARPAVPVLVERFEAEIESESALVARDGVPMCWHPNTRKIANAIVSIDSLAVLPGVEKLLASSHPVMRSMGGGILLSFSVIPARESLVRLLLKNLTEADAEHRSSYRPVLARIRPVRRDVAQALVSDFAFRETHTASVVAPMAEESDIFRKEVINGLNDPELRHYCAYVLKELGLAAVDALPVLESLALAATGNDRQFYLWVLDAIDPPFNFLDTIDSTRD